MEINSPVFENSWETLFPENQSSFQERASSHQMSAENKYKWKFMQKPFINTRLSRRSVHTDQIFLLFHILFFVLKPVPSQSWDDIIVTESDYHALQAFKHDLIDPKNMLKSWNDTGNGVCSGSWAGIKCARGQIIVIHLPWSGLSGRISEKIGQFQALRELSLHDNVIGGLVPYSLGLLPNLRDLKLFNNRFSGSIPPSLGFCSFLQTLDLANNSLSGPIPDIFSNLTKLLRLDFSFNQLTGSIPSSLTESASLVFLDLQNNNLSGSSTNLGHTQLCGYSASTPCPILSSQAPPEAALPDKKRYGELSIKDLILILLGTLLIILLVACAILILWLLRITKRVKETKNSHSAGTKGIPANAEEVEASAGTEGKLVHFDELKVFSTENLLCATAEVIGRSTYGTVYKTTMENGIQVAVKRLREKITKGPQEFFTEVNALGKIRHPNLLALRAYYLGPKGEKLLIFDYMSNGSLATFLHVHNADAPINWATRIQIAKDVARGLFYLHNKVGITHGNLTSSNVLLDEHKNAKISDYGLSRLMSSASNANVVATSGALGYRAPELSELRKATTKTDIYSFGVIMLELLTGRSPGDGMDLPQWVASIVRKEWTNGVFDVELMRDQSVSGDELLSTLKLALRCVDLSPSDRPEALPILRQLEEIARPETDVDSSGEDGETMPSPSA
ncbi:Nodulation receptor kinase precursor [Dorcoceras hygrometricum]|uniref:Nodulation receptor kinase n=1 Tax=Dorcoceras hygrometricum TaxID=472368 RepID=A0A2Z7BKU0_9LAMI|nr:Nodulation receptor kinase precursor [Dorcoceras hygrometricum]